MFTMLRELGLRRSLSREAPSLIISFGIAEWLYKFHSFTLECLAFLATWFVLSAVTAQVTAFLRIRRPTES